MRERCFRFIECARAGRATHRVYSGFGLLVGRVRAAWLRNWLRACLGLIDCAYTVDVVLALSPWLSPSHMLLFIHIYVPACDSVTTRI